MKKISVVIPTYDSKEYLYKLLTQLKKGSDAVLLMKKLTFQSFYDKSSILEFSMWNMEKSLA